MSGARRWPLHPEPGPGEALSSWLTRLGAPYGLSVPDLVDHGLGAALDVGGRRGLDRLDLDPPAQVLAALEARTGVGGEDLRLMTIAGWVPWLLDDIHPDRGRRRSPPASGEHRCSWRLAALGSVRHRAGVRGCPPRRLSSCAGPAARAWMIRAAAWI